MRTIFQRRYFLPSASNGRIFKEKALHAEASFTAEASMVIPIVLIALGSLIVHSFDVYDSVLINCVVNEAVENYGHADRNERDEALSEEYMERRLKCVMSGSCFTEFGEYRENAYASAGNGRYSAEIHDRGFCPEKIMRTVSVIEEVLDDEQDN